MNKMYYCMCIIVLGAIYFEPSAGKTMEYYYDKLVEEPTTDERLFEVKLDVRKSGATEFIVSADVNQLVELKNDSQISIAFNCAEENGEYVELIAYPIIHICDFMDSDYIYFYNQFKNSSNIPEPSTCPVPPKKYTLTDTTLSLDFMSKLLFPANYRLDIHLYRDSKLLVSYLFYGRVKEE